VEINDATLMETLKTVVAERPNFVYRRPEHMEPIVNSDGDVSGDCLYVHTEPDDETALVPGCLVGTVLHRLGVPLRELRKHEGRSGWSVVDEFGADDSRTTLHDVQLRQDRGVPWGKALELALSDPSDEAIV
jgi:hypothetical protein